MNLNDVDQILIQRRHMSRMIPVDEHPQVQYQLTISFDEACEIHKETSKESCLWKDMRTAAQRIEDTFSGMRPFLYYHRIVFLLDPAL